MNTTIIGGLKDLPWEVIWKLARAYRKKFFTADYKDIDIVVMDSTADELEDKFGAEGYDIDWPFSYHYKGEDMNVRTAMYDMEKDRYRQWHVRGWDRAGKNVALDLHGEYDPFKATDEHINDKGMTEQELLTEVMGLLEKWGYDYGVASSARKNWEA